MLPKPNLPHPNLVKYRKIRITRRSTISGNGIAPSYFFKAS